MVVICGSELACSLFDGGNRSTMTSTTQTIRTRGYLQVLLLGMDLENLKVLRPDMEMLFMDLDERALTKEWMTYL